MSRWQASISGRLLLQAQDHQQSGFAQLQQLSPAGRIGSLWANITIRPSMCG
ncbi:MAG: hypothetical protein WCE68_14850 [Anaerolineales bacterium]